MPTTYTASSTSVCSTAVQAIPSVRQQSHYMGVSPRTVLSSRDSIRDRRYRCLATLSVQWAYARLPRGVPLSQIYAVTDAPRGSVKHVRFMEEAAIQDLRERAEKILAIRESEELAEEAVCLGHMVSSNAPLY